MDDSNGGTKEDIDLSAECIAYFKGYMDAIVIGNSEVCANNASMGT